VPKKRDVDENGDSEYEIGNDQKGVGSAKGVKQKGAFKLLPQTEDHNHEYCEVCNDGGDLICCDVCPCAYHEHCLRAKAEDLPDPYKCPQCTGEFDKLLNQYMSHPQTSIMNRDFCDLCGLEASDKEKGGQGPLIGCNKCDHAYHTFCAGETEDLFKNNGHWCWECPECKGTAAEVFAWSRLIVPIEKEDAAEGIFVEHNKTVAVVLGDGVGLDTGGGGVLEEEPAARGKKSKGRGSKAGGRGDKADKAATPSGRAASKGAVYKDDDDEPDEDTPKKKFRGRPRKTSTQASENKPVRDRRARRSVGAGKGESDGGDEEDEEEGEVMKGAGSRSTGKSLVRSPSKSSSKTLRGGDDDTTPSKRRRRSSAMRPADDED